MDIIDEIYRNSIQPSETTMRKDKQYLKAKNQVIQCYKFLSEKFSDKEMETLDKLMASYDTKIKRKNVHCFKAGFKTGISIAVEALE